MKYSSHESEIFLERFEQKHEINYDYDFGIYKGGVLLKAQRQTRGEIRLPVFQIKENSRFLL